MNNHASVRLSRLSAVCAMVLLSGCAVTKAGPNAEATPVASAPPPPPPPAAKPTAGQEIAAVANNQVVILFPENSATLTSDSDHQLDLAVRLFRDAGPVLMFSTGYSDHSGDEYKNLILSGKRAEAVKRALVERGIPADRLLIRAMGESDLAVNDKPDSAENRRVTITWRLL